MRSIPILILGLFVGGTVAHAAQPDANVGNAAAPIPKLDADGPTSSVTGLAFSPDGQALYAAGWDKVIRVWRRDARGQFKLDAAATFRVPIGPGPAGQLNAIAVSSDGRRLAAAGNGLFRHGATFDRPGLIVPSVGSMDRAMREDQGTIFVFDVRSREVRQLRGHQGAVVALQFAEGEALLASAGQEWDETAKVRRGAVRLWNLTEEKALAVTKDLPEPKMRPALAVIHPPATSRAARLPTLAIAWGDERFLLWNPNTGQLQPANDGRYNNTVAQLPGLGVVTGNASGLKVWQTTEPPQVRSRLEQTLARTIPRAMAAAPSKSDANFDILALVAREPGTEEDRLYLVDPRAGQLLAQPVALWNGRGTQPAVAASSAGDVAVAGGRNHRILVYRAADIRQNRATRQVLDSSGESVRVATIARQGERYGLALSANPKEQPGQVRTRLLESDRVFDVSAAEFAADRRGWSVDAPDGGGWSVRHEARRTGANERIVLSVLKGAQVASRIELDQRQQLSDYALLAPRAPHNRPLLVVAYFDFESGQPVLAMFDGASGSRFREYFGHTGRITSVAFSRDGRLLVTAAEDQTACMWTLADLDQVLGVRGQLTGLKVDSRKGNDGRTQLLVAQADPALATAGLAQGDLLEGIVLADGVQSFDTVRALYEAISVMKPGTTAVLRRLRGANDQKDVKVVIGQGIDERKPLFTFFTSRAEGRRSSQWIGWSPLGPYESSDPAVEKLLGWHFNTGEAEAPVSFASVDQYRARFATKGLLLKLLETGRPQLPARREPDPPAMSLWLEEKGREPVALEPGTTLVVRTRPSALEASSHPFPADQVESIHWRIDERSGTFQPTDGQWRADLTGISWKRGRHPVQVWLKTMPPHRELKQVLSLVYQPPQPEVKSKLPLRSETSNEQFDFQAEVAPGAAGEVFRATLTHQHAAKDPSVVREVSSVDSWSVREKVRLQPGVNLLKLVAENEQAMTDRPDNERATVSFEVYYDPPKMIPGPRIELTELVVRAADGTKETRGLASEAAVVVNTPRVVLRGTVRGAEELAVARFRADPKREPTAVSGFVANKAQQFTFEQNLTLQPGVNRLSLEAQSAKSAMTERPIHFDYHPQLPTLTVRPLPQRVFDEQYSIVADLTPPADVQPYQVDVYLNDERLADEKVMLDEGSIRALATLRPGDNRLELRLSNQWGGDPVVQTLGVEYVRPPKILELTSDRQRDPDAVVMRLLAESERTPAAAIVRVNGKLRRIEFDAKETDRAGRWELDFKPLLLEPGENRINVSLKDERAESLVRELVINVEKRAAPTPEIVVMSHHNHALLPNSNVPVEVVVRSTSPIQDIVVDGSDRVLHSVSDLTRQKKNEQGFYEYFLKTVLTSGSDATLWRVEAVNDGGRKAIDIPNVVIVPPASIVLESVALRARRDRRFPLTKSGTGEPVLETELPEGDVVLSGYVLASAGTAEETRQIPVQVWVNGFLQKPVLAGRLQPGSHRRPFHAEIVLTRQNNLIEVGMVDANLPSDAANRTALLLNCATPNTARKLHLLVIAVGAKREEGAEVRKRAVAAVQGEIKSPRAFATPAFEQGVIHEVLIGSAVQRNKVLFEIGRLARNLRSNDVAMIYYQGNVREADDTFYLTTSASKSLADPKQTEIGRDELNRWFGNMAGAQLILLDVDRAATPEQSTIAKRNVKARWPADSHIAFFRFAWAPPEPPSTPNEPVLLTAWQQAARNARTLAQIDTGLASFSTQAAGRYPAPLVYDKHLPGALGRLDLGPVSDGP